MESSPGDEVCVSTVGSLKGGAQKFHETRAATYSSPLKPEVVAHTSPPGVGGQSVWGVLPFGPHAGGSKFLPSGNEPLASLKVFVASTVLEMFHFVGELILAQETS